MPDKSWRGMRPGPVTALCISYAFPDCRSSDLRKLFLLLWIATYVDYFLLALFWNTPTFMQMRLLAGIRKKCHFEKAIKVNGQVVCITKPSPVAAPFVSPPVSLFPSSLQADHENIFSFSQSWARAFWEDKHNIHLKARENPMAFFQWFQVMLSMSALFAYCYIQNVTATFVDMFFVDICLAFCF